jgi:hypothetical protein
MFIIFENAPQNPVCRGDASAVKELLAVFEVEEPGHRRNCPSRPVIFPILKTYNKHNLKLDCHYYVYPKVH